MGGGIETDVGRIRRVIFGIRHTANDGLLRLGTSSGGNRVDWIEG